MPNLPAHMHLALQAAAELDHPMVQAHIGSFLLGSTSPDIRAMTKVPRDQTHFAPLSVDRVGAGVEGMFRQNPGLKDVDRLNWPTKAFVAGYINHLVADESWITSVYRTWFDRNSSSENQVEGNIWDRAVQLDMDREARIEMNSMEGVRSDLKGADEGVDVGFISNDALLQWRDWILEFSTWEFTWDRLNRAMQRMYRDDPGAAEQAQRFLEEMPRSLERVYERMSPEALAAYRESTISSSVELIREYLDAP